MKEKGGLFDPFFIIFIFMISKNKKKNWVQKNWKLLGGFIGLLLMISTTPYLLTRNNIWDSFDFSSTGQIGDTIGGITAPFINLLGAILVYLSFQQQLTANRIQLRANEIQVRALKREKKNNQQNKNFTTLIDLFKELKGDVNSLSFQEESGINAIEKFADNVSYRQMAEIIDLRGILLGQFFEDYIAILRLFKLILNRVINSRLNADDRFIIVDMFYIYYIKSLSKYHERILNHSEIVRNHFGGALGFRNNKHLSRAVDNFDELISIIIEIKSTIEHLKLMKTILHEDNP